MLKNAYSLAKISADTAENEQHFAEILPIGRRGPSRGGRGPRGRPPRPAHGALRARPLGCKFGRKCSRFTGSILATFRLILCCQTYSYLSFLC